MTKIATVVGARPQFVKAAAVSRAIAEDGRLSEVLVHTGQHFDPEMSEVFFRELAIPPPAHVLGIHGGTHGQMTGRMLEAVEAVLLVEQPQLVMVYGDTNSTLAGALAAAKLRVPVAHVEAGLRSFNRAMPEELNRVVTDHVADVLFCPTTAAAENLRAEGITTGVHLVGDVMYDAALHAADRARRCSSILDDLGLQPGRFAVATVHRAENTDDPGRLRSVMRYLQQEAERQPVVLPLHPRTALALENHGIDVAPVTLCPPLGYLDMARLLMDASSVFTDSGGVQKEAYFYRVPCVTLRDETEWVETVAAGWNRLWHGPAHSERREITEYGDGHAARAVVEVLVRFLEAAKGHPVRPVVQPPVDAHPSLPD